MRKEDGFSLLELLMVVATIAILAAIAIPLLMNAIVKAHISAAATDAKAIYVAFKRFYVDNNKYPNASSDPKFELDTFEPLVSMDYYDGRVVSRLRGQRADGYDSPDDMGPNEEFWLEFSLRHDPTIRFLVCDSDDAPLGGGLYRDGIYLYRNGELQSM